MTTNTDIARVRMAHATPSDDGTLLSLMTVQGVEVKFLLDDLALGLLGLTIGTVMRAEERRVKDDPSNVRLYKKENTDSE